MTQRLPLQVRDYSLIPTSQGSHPAVVIQSAGFQAGGPLRKMIYLEFQSTRCIARPGAHEVFWMIVENQRCATLGRLPCPSLYPLYYRAVDQRSQEFVTITGIRLAVGLPRRHLTSHVNLDTYTCSTFL